MASLTNWSGSGRSVSGPEPARSLVEFAFALLAIVVADLPADGAWGSGYQSLDLTPRAGSRVPKRTTESGAWAPVFASLEAGQRS